MSKIFIVRNSLTSSTRFTVWWAVCACSIFIPHEKCRSVRPMAMETRCSKVIFPNYSNQKRNRLKIRSYRSYGEHGITTTEIPKNGYTRSSNNHYRVQLKSSTRTPPGRPLIGRTTVVPGPGSEQSGCTRCVELIFRSTRYWLALYPELVRSLQATRRRARTRARGRVLSLIHI